MQSIAIIGSGPTAIYAVHYLLADPESGPLAIILFESQSVAGKGTPYQEGWNDPAMLSNIASIEIPPLAETLAAWLERQTDARLAELNIPRDSITDRAFFPRLVLGNYFHAQLMQLVDKAARQGSELVLRTSHYVADVMLGESGIRIAVIDPARHMHHLRFDDVIMATGHSWPESTEARPGYFTSPWPASALRSISHCHVGIRGTSLSAIDALVTLATARGSFAQDENGTLQYLPEPGTEDFKVTLLSRKGLLPEADFYYPIPYAPLSICTQEAVDALVAQGRQDLLDATFALFKSELAACAPAYAEHLNLINLPLEDFCRGYFAERESEDPFVWAERNLAEAIRNQSREYTVPWRYAILRMHEVVARIAPHLHADDHARFNRHFKPIFIDDYATVPHESIERLLALHRAAKVEIRAIGEEYALNTTCPEGGALLRYHGGELHFPAFIEATGQRTLSAREFPFPSLRQQGVIRNATAPHRIATRAHKEIGGVALDEKFHPVSDAKFASHLYCLSLPFMLSQFPFAQGITSSHEMGRIVAEEILQQRMESPGIPYIRTIPITNRLQ